MSAIVALYIDVLHDVDVGVDADVSDRKLADIPGVLSIFKVSEKSQYERIREVSIGPYTCIRACTRCLTC